MAAGDAHVLVVTERGLVYSYAPLDPTVKWRRRATTKLLPRPPAQMRLSSPTRTRARKPLSSVQGPRYNHACT
jgi:hypothetical protein